MGEDVLVRSGDAEFWVRVADAGGPSTIGISDAFSFDGVRRTVEEDRRPPVGGVGAGQAERGRRGVRPDPDGQEREAHRAGRRW